MHRETPRTDAGISTLLSNYPRCGAHMQEAVESLLKPEQAAQRLAIAESTLNAWRCTGRQDLPFVKIGSAVRYRPADVDEFVAKRLQAA